MINHACFYSFHVVSQVSFLSNYFWSFVCGHKTQTCLQSNLKICWLIVYRLLTFDHSLSPLWGQFVFFCFVFTYYFWTQNVLLFCCPCFIMRPQSEQTSLRPWVTLSFSHCSCIDYLYIFQISYHIMHDFACFTYFLLFI